MYLPVAALQVTYEQTEGVLLSQEIKWRHMLDVRKLHVTILCMSVCTEVSYVMCIHYFLHLQACPLHQPTYPQALI